jgi:hypothetical protein
MYSELELYVHAGPVSLLAMSQLDWERPLLQEDSAEGRSSVNHVRLSLPLVELCLRSLGASSQRNARPSAPRRRTAEGLAA